MKQLRKKIVAVICVVAMLVGVVVPNGLTLKTKAADTATQSTEATDSTAREWWVYGDDDADTGLVVTGSGSRKSISDAGINLPEGLIEANLSLQIKLNVSATNDVISALNSVNAATFELANEINDAGELSWTYGGLQSGENNLTFLFKNAAHTNGSAVNGTAIQDGKSPFDWEETIDFFGLYLEGYSTDAAALSITVESVKIVYTDAGLTFGADDTYLQLDKPMSATPNAVEAAVNMEEIDNRVKWTLHEGSTFSGVSMPVGSYTTTSSDAPGAGMECFTLDANSAAITGFEALQHSLAIDASAYTIEELAIGFWVYSSTAGTLATGFDNGQIRLSSNADNMSNNCLFYYMYEISVNAGWTYVEIPLSSMKDDIKQDFTLSNINTWGIAAGYQVPQGTVRYFGDFELIALESGNTSEEEEELGWILHSGSTFSGVSMSVGSYTTTASDTPGEGMTCFTLDASGSAISGFEALQTNLGIDASAYDMSDLTFAFWLYSNKDTTLGADWAPHIRISSNADNVSSNCLFYYMYEISVNAGWNYIEIPLGKMKDDIIGDFSVGNINTWGITSYAVPQGTQFYFGDMMLLPPEETVDTGEWTLHAGTSFSGVSMSVGSYTTTASDAPGAGMNCFTLDASSAAISGFEAKQTNLGIDASAHKMEDLSVAFWLYSNKTTTLGADWNPQLRIGSNVDNVSSNCLFYYMYEIPVNAGWNYIEIPLSKMKTDIIGNFSIGNINTWGITSFGVPQGTKFYFGDIKLVDPNFQASYNEGDITVTTNVTSISDNYMIFSNANAAGESNPYAMYVTTDGYLGFLYGTTQFVLNQRVDTGANVNVKTAINASGQVEFYIDGSLVATSQTTVSSIGAPITPYCIGADGAGAQTFVGTIKGIKTYSDVAATACTGSWPLIGDIRYVVETMPDVSGNNNNATFKGTRANDWYNVEAIGEDDWSLVFIPDIVQRFYAGEHATWHKMASWIGDNVEKENIKYVIGSKTADPAQTDAMNYGYGFFDSAVPTTNFNTATDNSYYRFSVNGVKWMILSLKTGWDADASAVFTWGKEVIAQYPNDNVIIACDTYYNSVWSEFNSVNQNVKLIVYGIQGGAPSEDAPVMNFPAQNDLENNYFGEQGLGLLYMLRFTDGGTKVTARSYAPIYDSYFTGVVNYEKAIETESAPEVEIKKYEGATPGVAPTDVPTGMLFAGWFKKGQVQEWLLSPENGDNFSGQSLTPEKYTTTESDEPGAGMTCFILSESSTASANFEALQTYRGIDAGSYGMDELALGFWVYSNVAGVLDDPSDTNWAHIRISSNDDNVSGNCLFYYMQNISVNAGWNYIEIPLSSFEDDIIGDFSLTNVDTFGITSYKVPTGMELKFGDFELIAYGADCSKESALTSVTTGTAYARFVDKDLLTVKAQIKASTSDQSNYSDIRFVTSVDRLEYKRMGFEISYEKDNGSIKEIKGGATENNIVYQKLYVVGADGGEPEGYTPKEIIAASSVYFKAYTITNVPNRAFDRDFNVRAYWVTMDGTKVYGDYVDKSVWMGYQTRGEFLPVIVNTTYETDDVVIADVVLNDLKYGYVTEADVANADYDWSTALQNALTDVHNKGGGTVYVPAGQYKLTKSITIPSDVTLRGDWQDPDVGTKYGTIFNIYPTQELGVNRNADASHNQNTAAFVMTGSSGVVGITAYYPNQSIADGSAVPYPYTFYVTVGNDGGQLITLKNITVINGYRGVGTRYEMQHEALIIDNFKGTFLDCGLAIYNSSDTGTISNVSFSSKYWKECSLGAVDASAYVLANNATAIELGDLEWHQLSNCAIDGYNVGISIVPGYRTNFSGSMIDMSITGCVTGITIADEINETYYGNLNIKEVGDADTPDKQEYPLNKALDPRWGLVIARSTIEGTTNAIVNNSEATTTTVLGSTTKVNQTPGLVRLTDVEVDEDKVVKKAYTKNNVFDSTSYNVQSSSEDLGTVVDATAQYDATYTITEAQKKNLWVVEGIQAYDGANVDVSELINAAMDKVLERNANGGIVYVPGGTYRLDNPITVPAGVELHGASSVANREQYMDGEGTLFMVYYGDDDTHSTTDTALVTLAGDNSGISGVRFLYPENISTNAGEAADQKFYSTYTIAANGASNVHVTNCFIAISSYGVDLQNCNDFHMENLFTCVYRNAINVADSTGVIRGAWTNPNAIARTTAEGLTANWPEEAVYNNSTAPINIIRNYLKDNLTFIQVSGSTSDVLIHNITAYAHNKTVAQSGGNVLVMNSNADSLDHENGVQFTLSGGTMKAINALRAAITDTGSSQDAATRFLYSHTKGTLAIYNSMMAKSTEKNSAWENNYNTTK